jgi:hypothetical protein
MQVSMLLRAGLLTIALVLSSSPLLADGHCDRGPETFKLKIKLKQNKPTAVTHKGKDAEDFPVCLGDSIEWQVSGFGRKDFYLVFEGQVPTSGDKRKNSNNGKLLVKIDGGEARAGNAYKYLLGVVDGGEWDPRIIIER